MVSLRGLPQATIDGTISIRALLPCTDLSDDVASEKKPQKPDLKILDINLVGVMYTIKLALHYFRKQYNAAVNKESGTLSGNSDLDTCLVLQGSLAGFVDQPGSPQYNSSKFALRGTMRCLRRTVLQHGTRINYIAPW